MANNTEKYYLIGEVMSLTGATREMLRNYERSGLIQPITAGENNYRLYSSDDIRKIVKIGVLDELGLDTKAAKKVTIGRGEMRKELVSQEFDLTNIVRERADELGEIISKLINCYSLAKLLEYEILPHFTDSENDELKNYINGINNGVNLSKKYIQAFRETAQTVFNSPHSFSIIQIIDRLYSFSLSFVTLTEKAGYLLIPDGSDDERRKHLITFINTHNKAESEEYLNHLSKGLLEVTSEVAKAKNRIMEYVNKAYYMLFTKYKWIPEKSIPQLLSTLRLLIYEKTTLSDNSFGELIVSITDPLSDCLNLLFEEQRDSTYYINALFDLWSNIAKKNYDESQDKGDEPAKKTPLYKFFEEMS